MSAVRERFELSLSYGLYVMNFGEASDARFLCELAGEAEDAGWNGIFLTDTIMYYRDGREPVADSLTALAAIAVNTKHIRIGTAIASLPRRPPWLVAREAVTIDRLSDGRLTLGVGLGDPPDSEFQPFGQESEAKIRGEKLDEALDILTGLWTGKEFSYHGKHYQVDKTRFLPTPRQEPRVPIWVGGSWPNKPPFRRAARWDGVIPIKNQATVKLEPTDLLAVMEYVRKQRTSKGPFDIVVIGNGKSEQEIEARRQRYEQQGITWWLKYLPRYRNSRKEMIEQVRKGPPD